MKGILVLGVIAALAVAPGGSLDCPQCSSFDDPCDSSDVSECPADASTSCVVSYAEWPAATPPTHFQNLACSNINAELFDTTGSDVLISFYVRVADGETAWLESQFCNGGPCSSPSPPPEYPDKGTGDIQYPGCIGVNTTTCEETLVTCNPDERFVDAHSEVMQGDKVVYTMRIKGCSNITDKLCGLLSTPNARIGNIVFVWLICSCQYPITETLNSGAVLAGAP